ncbi:hypothetical protein ACQZV8_15075 [Magnetococcales bacterium HHB-1]
MMRILLIIAFLFPISNSLASKCSEEVMIELIRQHYPADEIQKICGDSFGNSSEKSSTPNKCCCKIVLREKLSNDIISQAPKKIRRSVIVRDQFGRTIRARETETIPSKTPGIHVTEKWREVSEEFQWLESGRCGISVEVEGTMKPRRRESQCVKKTFCGY